MTTISPEQLRRLKNVLKDAGAIDVQKWIITKDGIKRQYRRPDGTASFQRLPKAWYKDLDAVAIKDLLSRLNAEDWRLKGALKRYEIQSAFIPANTLDEFEKKLRKESNAQTANSRMQNLTDYCLMFFLPRSPNPIAWQKDLQDDWVDYLVSLDYSPSTYKHIKIALNKFMRFLATKNQDLPVLQFDGLTRFQIAEIRFKREQRGLGVRRYITEEEYDTILQAAELKLRPYIEIAYNYGLRRNEILALKVESIKNSYLAVDWQLKNGKRTKPKYLKGRKVPHWFMKPKALYKAVESLKPYEDTVLSEAFTALTTRLYNDGEIGAAYVLHDCRHSFVSNAVGIKRVEEVMHAAGHADLRTTSAYLKDTRRLDDETFDPTGS